LSEGFVRVVDIFDEVSDDLRAERTTKFLRRYGSLMLLAAGLVLLGVAGYQGYIYWQAKQNQQAAAGYLAITTKIDQAGSTLTDADRASDAADLVNFAAHAPAGYATLARLRAAALFADAGQLDKADAQWDAVSSNGQAGPLMRDLATLLWAQHALGTAPDATVLAKLSPLMVSANPWHALAQETAALADIKSGDINGAKMLLNGIVTDNTAAAGVRDRADGLLAQLNG
jgi:hypothetical protein